MTAVFLLLIAVRIPALTGTINLSPDATEYIDIARNYSGGKGLTLGIRAYFFGDGVEIPYPAESLRSPLFPVLMACVYALVPSHLVFQWFNFGLFLVNMALLTLILRPLLPPKLMAYSLLLAGMTESMFLTSIFPWAEQTAFFWLLLALLMASRELHMHWGVAGALLEGLVAAMAGLSRPEYLLVGILLFLWLAAQGKRKKPLIGAFLTGMILPLAIVLVAHLHQYGRTFLPGGYLFRSRDYASYFTWENLNRQGPWGFVAGNWLWIMWRVLRNFVNYAAKLIGWKNLFALAVVLPLVLWKTVQTKYDWRKRHLAFVAAAFFFSYCLVWAGIDRERYLLPITSLLLPLCLFEVDQWRQKARHPWARRTCLAIMFANLPLFLSFALFSDARIQKRGGLAERFYAKENPAWSNPDREKLAAWMRVNVREKEVVCLENPFLLNYETGCAAVVLPEQMRPDVFAQFLRDYRVRYWINNTVFTKWPRERLEALERAVRDARAQEVAQCGTYRIWRIR